MNLPEFEFKTRLNNNNKLEIFDSIRKKFVSLTPEENVRQHFIQYLILYKKFPPSLMAVEKGLKINNLNKRADIVQYNKKGIPIVIVECKAPNIKINENTFLQTAMYNIQMKVNYLIMTNGTEHYFGKVNYSKQRLDYLNDIPNFDLL